MVEFLVDQALREAIDLQNRNQLDEAKSILLSWPIRLGIPIIPPSVLHVVWCLAPFMGEPDEAHGCGWPKSFVVGQRPYRAATMFACTASSVASVV